jgi:hypothetical protein
MGGGVVNALSSQVTMAQVGSNLIRQHLAIIHQSSSSCYGNFDYLKIFLFLFSDGDVCLEFSD